ncbi:MAG: Type 1 glutamine amidotransferase-like domain-containing protein [archaeon]
MPHNTLQKWAQNNKENLDSICFIPSGEEVFIIGVSKDKKIPISLIKQFKKNVLKELEKTESYIKIKPTKPNFGGCIFNNKLNEKIEHLLKTKQTEKERYINYLKLIEHIRNKTAKELDKMKFKDVINGRCPIQIRNLVFSQMLNYKKNTNALLKNIDKIENSENLIKISLKNKYGIKENETEEVESNINHIIENEKNKLIKSLILIGGGIMRKDETIKIDKWIVNRLKNKKVKKPKVLLIPTASLDLKEYIDDFSERYISYGCKVEVLRLIKATPSNQEIETKFLDSNLIYICGGDSDILLETFRKYELLKNIKTSVNSGSLIAGLSAGAAIWFENYIDFKKNSKAIKLKKGLGIILGLGVMHFNNTFLKQLEKLDTNHKRIIGIENQAALYFSNKLKYQVISETQKNKAYIGLALPKKIYLTPI